MNVKWNSEKQIILRLFLWAKRIVHKALSVATFRVQKAHPERDVGEKRAVAHDKGI